MNKEEVYAQIENHFRSSNTALVKGLAGRTGGIHNAEDVVQEAYIRAMKYWQTYDPARSFDTWFNRIVSSAASDHKKKERVRGAVVEESGQEAAAPDLSDWKGRLDEVKTLIASKKEPNASILELYFIYGWKQVDIEQVVDRSRKAIEMICRRFRTEVKEALG